MIIEAIIITIMTYKGSQAVNHISGGQDGLTLTEQSYQECQNENRRCVEAGIYTAVFLPVDVPAALAMGKPDLIGSHGATWHEIDKHLPQISEVKPYYGGRNYYAFIQKRK